MTTEDVPAAPPVEAAEAREPAPPEPITTVGPSPETAASEPPAQPEPTPPSAAPPEVAEPEPDPSTGVGRETTTRRPNFFRRLGPVGKVVSGLVAAISFVTGIIAVVPIFTSDTTNFGSLRVSAAPFGSERDYAVPATAPFATFPSGEAGTCTAAQQQWLESHGTRITTRYLLDLRNVASSGAMLALKSFRATGTTTGAPPAVRVVCDPDGAAAPTVQAARLPIGRASDVAYFDKSAFGQTAKGIPDSPVVWNLAPGETGQLVLDLYPTESFDGTLTTTAFSGSDHRDVPIPLESKKRITVPALVSGGMTFLQVDAALACVRMDAGARTACDIGDLVRG